MSRFHGLLTKITSELRKENCVIDLKLNIKWSAGWILRIFLNASQNTQFHVTQLHLKVEQMASIWCVPLILPAPKKTNSLWIIFLRLFCFRFCNRGSIKSLRHTHFNYVLVEADTIIRQRRYFFKRKSRFFLASTICLMLNEAYASKSEDTKIRLALVFLSAVRPQSCSKHFILIYNRRGNLFEAKDELTPVRISWSQRPLD